MKILRVKNIYTIYQNRGKGFTLLEVMTVIAIISIMTGVVLVSLGGQNRSESFLESASRVVSAHIREIQNSTLTGRSGSLGEISCGFGIHKQDGTHYQLFLNDKSAFGDCSSASEQFDGAHSQVSYTHTMEDGVTIGALPDIYYLTPHAGFYVNGLLIGGNSPQQIELSHDGETYYICVYPKGEVVENGTYTCSH